MKNDYNKKKRNAIITLSVLAVCLTGGLFWYMESLEKTQPPVAQTERQPEPESAVTVPEIKPERTEEPSSTTPKTTSEPEQESSSEAATVTGDVQAKPSEGKPKSPAEATPPAEPPKDTAESNVPAEKPEEKGQRQPENKPRSEPDQPQGGEKKNGKIYIPGFGWIEDEGGGSKVHEAPNAGTGKPIGEM